MRTRWFILSLIPLSLLAGGLLLFALPARAQDGVCENASIDALEASVFPMEFRDPGELYLHWYLKIDPWPDEFELDRTNYRIDRRPVDAKTWETVDTTADLESWEGPTDPGRWVYRVSLISLRSDDGTEECDGVSAEVAVDLPTERELAEAFLVPLCMESEVISLAAVRLDNGSVMLEWDDQLDKFFANWYVETVDPPYVFNADRVIYRVQRAIADADGWTTLAETTERTWASPAEPGRWTYRVGTVRMEAAGVSQECEPWYDEVFLHVQTEEEAAEQERKSAILLAEAARCANETLTSSLQGEARETVAGYVSRRVSEIVDGKVDENDPGAGFRALVGLTVLLCAEEAPPTGDGASAGPVWGTLTLLGISDWDR